MTSRNRLDELDASYRLAVDTLPEPDAVAVLRELSGRDEDFAEIARLCGYLPLALRAVGPLLGRIPAADVAASLGEVDELDQKVRAAFTASYEDLSAELQRLLRWCAFHPGPDFDAGSAAAIWDLPESVAAIRIGDLAKRNLLLPAEYDRYTFHDLFRTYTRELADTHDHADAVLIRDRLFTGLLMRLGVGPIQAALTEKSAQWLEAATPEIIAVMTEAFVVGGYQIRGPVHRVGRWLRANGRPDPARNLYRRWLHMAVQAADERSQAEAWLGLAEVAWSRHEYGEAAEGFRRALALFEDVGDRRGQAEAMWNLAEVTWPQGEYADAVAGFRDASMLYEEVGSRGLQADVWRRMAKVARRHKDFALAGDGYWRALALYEEVGSREGQAAAHYGLGLLAEALADTEAACRSYRNAREFYVELGNHKRAARCSMKLIGLDRE